MRISDWSSDVCSSDLSPGCRAPKKDWEGDKMLQRTYRVERKAIWLAGCSAVLVAGGTPVSAIEQSTTGTVPEEAQAADSTPAGEIVVNGTRTDRSEERRGGEECGRTWRQRGAPD